MCNKTKAEIMQLIDEEDVEFIRLQFTDMFGELKNVAVTVRQLEKVLDRNYPFDGASLYGSYDFGEEEMYLKPDLSSFVILPWRPQQGKVARLLCDVCYEDGTLCPVSPRNILQNVVEKAKEKGYTFYVNSECEFFLFHTDDNGMPTTITHEQAGLMDVGPMDLGENARRGIVLDLERMGFDIETSYHEKAPAQHEIEFSSAEVMHTADAIVTFKNAVRSIAKRFGLHATFMPKPLSGVAGSGMHLSFSVYKEDRNIFNCREEKVKRTDATKYFMGGIMKYAREMCPITNPLVNSYKRLIAGFDAPANINWTSTKGNTLVKERRRVGDDTKVEVRFPDPAANPYLALAVCIAAGLRGIEEEIDPGQEDVMEAAPLPVTLREALDEMRNSQFMEEILGEEFKRVYLEVKNGEWSDYMSQVSDWEIQKYLYRT